MIANDLDQKVVGLAHNDSKAEGFRKNYVGMSVPLAGTCLENSLQKKIRKETKIVSSTDIHSRK